MAEYGLLLLFIALAVFVSVVILGTGISTFFTAAGSAFLWLVSLDDPELAFAVTDPRTIFPGYCPKVDAQARARVEAEEHDELEILAVATVRDGEATLNLAAPVVVNPRSRRGAQVVLEDEAVSARTPLPAAPREETPAARPDAQIESKPQT